MAEMKQDKSKSEKMKLISLTSDFKVQSHGVAAMHGAILNVCPGSHIINFEHGINDFDILEGARIFECVVYLPVGCHVCVIDPGVGTSRKGIVIKTKRGDYLIGPDNGVMIPAARVLGFEKAYELANHNLMNSPVSPIFHGRDVFSPAAAHLANGVPVEEFGKEIEFSELAGAPYEEAVVENGIIEASVISINKFGSLHLNILHKEWEKLQALTGERIQLDFESGEKIIVQHGRTFSDVSEGEDIMMKDDYGRVEVATNMGSFAKKHGVAFEKVRVSKR